MNFLVGSNSKLKLTRIGIEQTYNADFGGMKQTYDTKFKIKNDCVAIYFNYVSILN